MTTISRDNNRQKVFSRESDYLTFLEANPLRAKLAKRAGEYRWSSFGTHGDGRTDPLLDPTPAYDALGKSAAT